VHFAAHGPEFGIEGLAAKFPVDFAAGLINFVHIKPAYVFLLR